MYLVRYVLFTGATTLPPFTLRLTMVNIVVIWGKPHVTWPSSLRVPLFTVQLTMVNEVVVCGEPHLTCPATDRLPQFTVEPTIVNDVVISGQPHCKCFACPRYRLENYATLQVVGGSHLQIPRCHIWWLRHSHGHLTVVHGGLLSGEPLHTV